MLDRFWNICHHLVRYYCYWCYWSVLVTSVFSCCIAVEIAVEIEVEIEVKLRCRSVSVTLSVDLVYCFLLIARKHWPWRCLLRRLRRSAAAKRSRWRLLTWSVADVARALPRPAIGYRRNGYQRQDYIFLESEPASMACPWRTLFSVNFSLQILWASLAVWPESVPGRLRRCMISTNPMLLHDSRF